MSPARQRIPRLGTEPTESKVVRFWCESHGEEVVGRRHLVGKKPDVQAWCDACWRINRPAPSVFELRGARKESASA
jgi:hypothetical protein